MKNYLLSILLLTYLLTYLLTSCTSDDLTYHDSHDNHKHLNEISFSEFKEKTNQKKFNPFAFNVDKNKRLNENLYFRIDTTVVKQNTLANGKVNFTLRAFSMQPESEDVFYNIIYYNKDEKWYWSIMEIPNNFMTQEKTSIKEVLNSINGANNLINSKLVGTWVTTTSYHCNGEGECATGECDGCNVCVSTSISYEYVDLPNTEEYYFVIAPTPGGGGGGGGMSAEQKALNSFINSLNIQQLNIFYNHPELTEYLFANLVEIPRFELINPGTGNGGIGIYDPNPTPQLPEYGFSQEAKDFVNWALNFLADNPNVTSSQFQSWISLSGSINTDLANEIKNLSTTKFGEYIVIISDLENFNNSFQANSFDPLNSPWIRQARQKVSDVENWSNNLGPAIKKKTNEIIDKVFIEALKLIALNIYPDVENLNEIQKQNKFNTNSNHGVAILLHEFATGSGLNTRYFENNVITQDFISGERETNIKNNFFNKLTELNLTYDQFISNNEAIRSGYAFSPDHTSVNESINEHMNANLLQFFIGGSINYYVPTEQYGWIKVIVANDTSRNSLLLHQASNYERTETTNNKPLSTIKQRLVFLIKIN